MSEGVYCEICRKRINIHEPMTMFSKTRFNGNKYMHLCCFQEAFLCEVWGALQLGIQYRSHCEHTDMTGKFDPLNEKEKTT